MPISLSRTMAVLMALFAALLFANVEFRVGIRLRLGDLFLILALPVVLTVLVGGRMSRDILPALLCLLLYVGYAILNGLYFSGPLIATKRLLQYALYFGIAFPAFAYALRDDILFTLFFKVLLFVLLGIAAYCAGWHLAHGMLSGWKETGEQKLVFGVLLLIVFGIRHPRAKPKCRQAMLLLLLIAAMVLSGERKGWLAVLAAALVMMQFPTNGSRNRSMVPFIQALTLMLVILGGLKLATPAIPYLAKQVNSLGAAMGTLRGTVDLSETTVSNRERVLLVGLAGRLIAQSPLFGTGLDGFVTRAERLPGGEDSSSGAHNEYLRIAAELGYLGLGLYLAIYVVAVARLAKLRTAMRKLTVIQSVRLRLAAGFLVYGFVINFFLSAGGTALFFVIFPLGLTCSIPIPARESVDANSAWFHDRSQLHPMAIRRMT